MFFYNSNERHLLSLQLRVIVYNVQEVVLSDTSFTGEKMSDIYVKGYVVYLRVYVIAQFNL